MSEQDPSIKFAHPSEETFAKILDFYGVPWEYEPHTFTLEEDDAGNVIEAFSPDFYLPEQDLYTRFGKQGRAMARHARGIDRRAVQTE